MEDFINQINYPVVSVDLSYDDKSNETIVSFAQKRFIHSIINVDLANFQSRFK